MSLIVRIDPHNETTPSGATVPLLPQLVKATPNASQAIVKINGEPVLVEGDTFACEHMPKVGVFTVTPPKGSGEGQMQQPGQAIVKIDGVLICTLEGSNHSCSDGVRELTNRATVLVDGPTIVTMNNAPALTGR